MTVAFLIPELKSALEQGTDEKRSEALRKITSLFLENASRFSEDHVCLFDDVFVVLIAEIGNKARQELSRRLAPIENSPLETVRRLAKDDDILIAGPLLVQSSRITTADLVEIASSRSAEHLCAIAGRPRIEIQVTDLLVARGDFPVKRKLAGNAGAQISQSGFGALIRSAKHDSALAEIVALRTDIPDPMLRDLIARAPEAVQRRLLAKARPEIQAEIRQALAQADGETGSAKPVRDFSAARQKIKAMAEAGELSESRLAVIAQSESHDDTVAALSALTSVSVDVIDRLMIGERPDPILILCRAAGCSWSTARDILLARMGGGKATFTIEAVQANFDRLSESTAKRVVRFWQLSPGSLKAAV